MVVRSLRSRWRKTRNPVDPGYSFSISSIALLALSRDRAAIYTFALCRYKIEASCLPTPPEDPVTMNTLRRREGHMWRQQNEFSMECS